MDEYRVQVQRYGSDWKTVGYVDSHPKALRLEWEQLYLNEISQGVGFEVRIQTIHWDTVS